MSGEWKPGDVAMVKPRSTAPFTMLRTRGGKWLCLHATIWTDDQIEWARPLVVIDPEDREQVARLADELVRIGIVSTLAHSDVAKALREFAAPTPPKPAEPLGLGAVVIDRDGSELVRVERDDERPWRAAGGYRFAWDEIDFLAESVPGAEPFADWEIDLLRGAR